MNGLYFSRSRKGSTPGRQRRQRDGNYAVIFAVSMVGILGFAALAVDVSWLRLSALQAQNAADAGAHAAILAYRSTMDEGSSADVGASVVAMNMVAGETVTIDTNTDLEFGGWNYEESDPEFDTSAAYVNAVQVTVRRSDESANGPVNLLLSPIFGRDTANVVAVATGALRFREVMIAFDITSSMKDDFEEARQALLGFLDGMWRGGAPFPGDQIGLVTYVGGAEVWTDLDYVSGSYATVSSDWSNELDWCHQHYPNWNVLFGGAYYHDAPQMFDCSYPYDHTVYPWGSGANPASGITMAATELAATGSIASLKTIILVADGAVDCGGLPAGVCNASTRRTQGINAANAADAQNISIFTVYLDQDGNAAAEAYMTGLTRGYGEAFATSDSTDLPSILDTISSLIPVALVH